MAILAKVRVKGVGKDLVLDGNGKVELGNPEDGSFVKERVRLRVCDGVYDVTLLRRGNLVYIEAKDMIKLIWRILGDNDPRLSRRGVENRYGAC